MVHFNTEVRRPGSGKYPRTLEHNEKISQTQIKRHREKMLEEIENIRL